MFSWSRRARHQAGGRRPIKARIPAAVGPLLLAMLLLGGIVSPTAHAAPPVPDPSAEELTQLQAGDVVVRVDNDDWTVAFVNVAASPTAAFAAVMDLEARVGDVGALKEAERYLDEPGRVGVRWQLRIATANIVFHTLYQVDTAGLWCTYKVDPDKDNDVAGSEGSYSVVDLGGGSSRIIYRTRNNDKQKAPEWVQTMLRERSAKQMLGGMRDRAQQG